MDLADTCSRLLIISAKPDAPEVLGRLSAVPLLTEYAENWRRIEIYLGFLITKNACRARNHTWRLSSKKVKALAVRVGATAQSIKLGE
jgi:hypothetical protein